MKSLQSSLKKGKGKKQNVTISGWENPPATRQGQEGQQVSKQVSPPMWSGVCPGCGLHSFTEMAELSHRYLTTYHLWDFSSFRLSSVALTLVCVPVHVCQCMCVRGHACVCTRVSGLTQP